MIKYFAFYQAALYASHPVYRKMLIELSYGHLPFWIFKVGEDGIVHYHSKGVYKQYCYKNKTPQEIAGWFAAVC